MTLIDDLKKRTEDGLKTLKEAAQDIAFNVEKQARISKKKYLDISRLKREKTRLYTEIGEYVYDQLTSKAELNIESPFLKERLETINMVNEEIEEIEREIKEIEELKKAQPPEETGH